MDLLHQATSESQHRRGMLAVVRGLLEVMPTKLVNQRTRGSMPAGLSVLSLACNARDPHSERTEIVRLLVEKQAKLEVRNAFGATPLITVCQVGFEDVVRLILDAGANPHAVNNRGSNALDATPTDQEKVFQGLRKNHVVAK